METIERTACNKEHHLAPNNVDFLVTVKRIILSVFPLDSQINRSARQELNVLVHSGTCGRGSVD